MTTFSFSLFGSSFYFVKAAKQIFRDSLAIISVFFLWKRCFYGIILIVYFYCQRLIENKSNKRNKINGNM